MVPVKCGATTEVETWVPHASSQHSSLSPIRHEMFWMKPKQLQNWCRSWKKWQDFFFRWKPVKWKARSAVPNLFGPRDQFCGRQFSTGWGGAWGGFWEDSGALHVLCTLFLLLLHQVHLRSSGIRCRRLESPDDWHTLCGSTRSPFSMAPLNPLLFEYSTF